MDSYIHHSCHLQPSRRCSAMTGGNWTCGRMGGVGDDRVEDLASEWAVRKVC